MKYLILFENYSEEFVETKNVIEDLDNMYFGNQSEIAKAVLNVIAEFRKIETNPTDKDILKIHNMLDNIREIAENPTKPTPGEQKVIDKLLTIINSITAESF